MTQEVNVTNPETDKPEMFEQWVSYAGKTVYVAVSDRQNYASQPGWWCLAWRGDAEAVRARGRV